MLTANKLLRYVKDDKIHLTLSDQFNSVHTVIDKCIDIKTEKTLLG